MPEDVNMFVKPIIMKKRKHDLKSWIAKRKLIRQINKTSPSFSMMVRMHEFLSILRNSYMYDNNDSFHLFLGSIDKKYNAKNTLAMVYKENGFSIKFLLSIDTSEINIEIARNGKSKTEIEHISFLDGQYEFKDIYDQEKMLFIVSCLMNGVVELIEYYYKNKKL